MLWAKNRRAPSRKGTMTDIPKELQKKPDDSPHTGKILEKELLAPFFIKEQIFLYGLLPLSACSIIHRGLLNKTIPEATSVLIFAVPYFTSAYPERNLSLYCLPYDYHLYLSTLHQRLISFLKELYPQGRFAGFGDHSPLDERMAAAKAGIGVLGDNGLLLTQRYGSYVFLAEVLTDLPCKEQAGQVGECLHCGRCKKACPCHFEACASGIGQKKGALSEEEERLVYQTGLIWGCDRCQQVCPYQEKAEPSPIPFFSENILLRLDRSTLAAMPDEELRKRAFGWRGRQPIERNLAIFEKFRKEEEPC